MIFARKINKIPEFYMIFARKMPEFYILIAQKYFPEFWEASDPPPLPPSPVSYANDAAFRKHLLPTTPLSLPTFQSYDNTLVEINNFLTIRRREHNLTASFRLDP